MRNLLKPVAAVLLFSVSGLGTAQAMTVTFDELVPIGVISPCFGAAFACGGGVDSVIDSGNFRFTTFDNGVTHHGHLVSAPYASPQTPVSNLTEPTAIRRYIHTPSKMPSTLKAAAKRPSPS